MEPERQFAPEDGPERKEIVEAGEEATEATIEAEPQVTDDHTAVSSADKNLLDRLLYKGVLPRYAFPTDVATFHVFDANESTAYRRVYRYTPSQALSVALSQYAPGRTVVVGGKEYVSGAIYSTMKNDRYAAWQGRRLYAQCEICGYADTFQLDEAERRTSGTCPACGSEDQFGPYQLWLRPPGFAHPVDEDEGTSPDRPSARSYATRAKLSAPSPSDPEAWSNINGRVRRYADRKHLLVTNRGPRDRGYTYCTKCGRIEPTALPEGQVASAHEKPFPSPDEPTCPGGRSTAGLVLGTDFITDILLISLRVEEPVSLEPGALSTEVALRTLSEALMLSASDLLEVEQGELMAEYRPALTPAGQQGTEAEIYLYDQLAGGAGFSQQAGALGEELFRRALERLEECANECDASCYGCLRSYRNKFLHDRLDRFVGASLLRYLLDDDFPSVGASRREQSTDTLYEDLRRQADPGTLTIERGKTLQVEGIGEVEAPILAETSESGRHIITLHDPLTPGYIKSQGLGDVSEYSAAYVVNTASELVVRKNLPAATSNILGKMQ